MGYRRTSSVDYWLTDDGLTLLTAWARDGYVPSAIAKKIGVSVMTVCKWRDQYPEIKTALETGSEIVDYKVENALLKRALGFTSTEIKVTIGKKIVNGETVEMLKETTTKEIAPDVSACMAWLNNRQFDKWKRNRDKVVELSEEDTNLTITINRGKPSDDGLGDNVNQKAEFTVEPESEKDLDAWPEDWEEEESES